MRYYTLSTIASAAFAVAAAAQGAAAQDPAHPDPNSEPIAQFCSATANRQVDFWIGDWEVTDSTGAVVGTNVITRVAAGCGLYEYWRGAGGGTGTSINWHDPQTGEWRQVWVGLGLYLDLKGGIVDGSMVLSGERETQQGVVVDRITWTPLGDGRVRQVWEQSSEDGTTWQVLFNGLYAKR